LSNGTVERASGKGIGEPLKRSDKKGGKEEISKPETCKKEADIKHKVAEDATRRTQRAA